MVWKHVGSPPAKKFEVTASAGKVMATVFWDNQGVVLTSYLPKGLTVTGEYYASELRQLKEALMTKRRGKLGPLMLRRPWSETCASGLAIAGLWHKITFRSLQE